MNNSPDIAIIIAAYNRPASLKRLLDSIAQADFSGSSAVPLVISIDKSDSDEVIRVAETFDWKHGEKRIIAHDTNLGLKKHILSCGDLSTTYSNVIVLEDDLVVSPYFFSFAVQACTFYQNERAVAGISLYSYDHNELVGLPFLPIDDGNDNYFMQVPSSWGQLWTKEQWYRFKEFCGTKDAVVSDVDDLPDPIIRWPESSWKKIFYKYLLISGSYFVYPRVSFTTNFGDTGTHFNRPMSKFQVKLCVGPKQMKFGRFEESDAKYDAFHEIIPQTIRKWNASLISYDFLCDLTGARRLEKVRTKHLLSLKECSGAIHSFSNAMIPSEMNVMLKMEGKEIHFGESSKFGKLSSTKLAEGTHFSKVNVNLIKKGAYEQAQADMRSNWSFKVGNAILWPLRVIKKILN